MRHFTAQLLISLARRIMRFAHFIDDDLTGKFIYLPAIPEYEVPVTRIEVLRRGHQKDEWVVRNCAHGDIGYHSYKYLKAGRVDSK